MNRNHYIETKCFRVYAMILRAEADYVYIGKTAGRRLSAVYSRHTTGSVKATVGYFDQGDKPELYLLEEIQAPTSEAYKHVVAWCHLFRSAGYVGINHERTLYQADNLLPDTRKIVEQLSQEPLEEILQRSYLPHPAAADRAAEAKPAHKAVSQSSNETIQMNIRIRRQDKKLFDRFCKNAAINQREGFQLLLDQITGSPENQRMCELLQKRDSKITLLEKEKQKLKAQLDAWITHGKSEKEVRAEEKLSFLKNGIHQYLQMLFPDIDKKSALPEASYKKYTRDLPFEEKPQYPEEEGFLVLRLEAILWGNGLHRSCFLLGWGDDGKHYRLRYYPKAHYLGLRIRESSYALPGSEWYVGCQRSKDSAMDLIAAFPLFSFDESSELSSIDPIPKPVEAERKQSLDGQIRYAKKKQTQ